MNVLTVISLLNAYTFTLLGAYILKIGYREGMNRLAAGLSLCLIWWNLAYVFFYTAPTAEAAMFWHKLSSPGWIFIGAFASHFFLLLSNGERIKKAGVARWMYVIPVILAVKTFATETSPVARGLTQSTSGLGWTYVSNAGSPWFWLYTLYLLVFFTLSLYSIHLWAKKGGRLRFLKQARSIITLAAVMIAAGFLTDLILPALTVALPPMFNVLAIVWAIGLFYIIQKYRLMTGFDVASPEIILETAMDPIILLDREGIIVKCNEATASILKIPVTKLVGNPFAGFCEDENTAKMLGGSLPGLKSMRHVEVNLTDSLGKVINTMASLSVAENAMDGFVGIVLSLHDITRHKKLSRELEKMANYDKLTDLPNRRLFFASLEAALEDYKTLGREFALIYIDLDGFKSVNDTYGHLVGDALLVEVAGRFTKFLRKRDMVARIGGDEFVIMVAGDEGEGEAELELICGRIRELFREPFTIEGNECAVGVSLGVSRVSEGLTDVNALMRDADQKMYGEKTDKKVRYRE